MFIHIYIHGDTFIYFYWNEVFFIFHGEYKECEQNVSFFHVALRCISEIVSRLTNQFAVLN